jgi:hypothetical protein
MSRRRLKAQSLPDGANNILITTVTGDRRQVGHCFMSKWIQEQRAHIEKRRRTRDGLIEKRAEEATRIPQERRAGSSNTIYCGFKRRSSGNTLCLPVAWTSSLPRAITRISQLKRANTSMELVTVECSSTGVPEDTRRDSVQVTHPRP